MFLFVCRPPSPGANRRGRSAPPPPQGNAPSRAAPVPNRPAPTMIGRSSAPSPQTIQMASQIGKRHHLTLSPKYLLFLLCLFSVLLHSFSDKQGGCSRIHWHVHVHLGDCRLASDEPVSVCRPLLKFLVSCSNERAATDGSSSDAGNDSSADGLQRRGRPATATAAHVSTRPAAGGLPPPLLPT